MARTIAIGDIHGCSAALDAILAAIDPQSDDTIVPLGDYVDRGIDSKCVLDRLISLSSRCTLIPILGNHDEMMLRARQAKSQLRWWLDCGGESTLASYGASSKLSLIPEEHWNFLSRCLPYFETGTHVFTHGNYRPELDLSRTDAQTLRWLSLRDYLPKARHCSGKVCYVGHSSQTEVLDLDYLLCIDTRCCKGGWLTAVDVNSREYWQANERGQMRADKSNFLRNEMKLTG